MSQGGVNNTTTGPVPPSVATTYTTDSNSPAVPSANNLNVFGGDQSFYDQNGIVTIGSTGGPTLTVTLSNRLRGTGTTIGATTADLVTFTVGASTVGVVPSTIMISAQVSAFEAATPSGAGILLTGGVRGTGVATVLCGTPVKQASKEAAINACDADIVVSGNTAIIRVTGVAGLTIKWAVVAYFVPTT